MWFYVAFVLAGLGWAALIVFPRRPWANFWLAGVFIPTILGVMYTLVLLLWWNAPPYPGDPLGFFSLSGLGKLFLNPGLLLAGWIDLLVMPLVVGAWMARRAALVRVPYVYLLPALLATAAFPGTGFVLFAIVVAIGGRWHNVAAFEAVPPTDSTPVTLP
jgi:hypothetical protein